MVIRFRRAVLGEGSELGKGPNQEYPQKAIERRTALRLSQTKIPPKYTFEIWRELVPMSNCEAGRRGLLALRERFGMYG